jgi:cell division protease FtsH
VVLLARPTVPRILDPALLRAGRFDRQVSLDPPDKFGRAAILKVHLRKISLAPDADADQIAAMTPGFTGADLANLVNEAAMIATRRSANAVCEADFTQAVERIMTGPEKRRRLLNVEERRRVAHHEMGHALVAMALPGTDPVKKISIIPHGLGALGFTMQMPREDRYLLTKPDLENRLAVLLGGRAAETLIFGTISTGAADDLQRATEMARAMVMRYGMDTDLGPMTLAEERSALLPVPGMPAPKSGLSEATGSAVDIAVRRILEDALSRATNILEGRLELLREGASSLLVSETLSGDDLDGLRARAASSPDGEESRPSAPVPGSARLETGIHGGSGDGSRGTGPVAIVPSAMPRRA